VVNRLKDKHFKIARHLSVNAETLHGKVSSKFVIPSWIDVWVGFSLELAV